MKSNEDRFWKKVGIGEEDECWEWLAGRALSGYGTFRLDGRMRRAHRVAWALTYGGIPKGMCVLHRCDNPPCCNPAHLWLGSQLENIADREAKGRSASQKGVRPNSKLTDPEVWEIRRLLAETDLLQREIAEMFDVTQAAISLIYTMKTWAWL